MDRRRATTFFILPPFQPKRCGHASIPINPTPTRSLPDSLIRLLTFLLRYQHRQHLQPLQVIIPRQNRLSTLWQRSLHWCTKRSSKMRLWWHTSKPALLLRWYNRHGSPRHTNLSAPPFQNGTGCCPPPPSSSHKLQHTSQKRFTQACKTGQEQRQKTNS